METKQQTPTEFFAGIRHLGTCIAVFGFFALFFINGPAYLSNETDHAKIIPKLSKQLNRELLTHPWDYGSIEDEYKKEQKTYCKFGAWTGIVGVTIYLVGRHCKKKLDSQKMV